MFHVEWCIKLDSSDLLLSYPLMPIASHITTQHTDIFSQTYTTHTHTNTHTHTHVFIILCRGEDFIGLPGLSAHSVQVRLSLCLSLRLKLKGLLLYTVVVLFHVVWCIRQLWRSFIISCNITCIAYNQYTNVYPLYLLNTHIYVQLMISNQLPGGGDFTTCYNGTAFGETSGPGQGYGYGLSVLLDPEQAKGSELSSQGEFGWGGVASTFFFVCPSSGAVCVMLTQVLPSNLLTIRPQLRWVVHRLLQKNGQSGGGMHGLYLLGLLCWFAMLLSMGWERKDELAAYIHPKWGQV